jgi:hypothetical protein
VELQAACLKTDDFLHHYGVVVWCRTGQLLSAVGGTISAPPTELSLGSGEIAVAVNGRVLRAAIAVANEVDRSKLTGGDSGAPDLRSLHRFRPPSRIVEKVDHSGTKTVVFPVEQFPDPSVHLTLMV